jgi:cytochrome oxidase Cu insertion factor (SCO1/SenC/PrrC family)
MFNFVGQHWRDIMADQMFMFATMAGTMAALAALLFVSRGRRTRSRSTTAISKNEPPTSLSSSKNNEDEKGKKAKRYTSDGKPVYD